MRVQYSLNYEQGWRKHALCFSHQEPSDQDPFSLDKSVRRSQDGQPRHYSFFCIEFNPLEAFMTARPLPRFSHVRHSMKFVAILGLLSFVLLILFAFPAVSEAQTAQCTPTGSDCAIPEDLPLQFPPGFIAVSGDAVLAPTLNSNLNAVSDIFHGNNDSIDTGLDTGIGLSVFLFSGHNGTLPNPSTYSANAVENRDNPEGHGDTQYFGNGTDYHLETGVLSN